MVKKKQRLSEYVPKVVKHLLIYTFFHKSVIKMVNLQ